MVLVAEAGDDDDKDSADWGLVCWWCFSQLIGVDDDDEDDVSVAGLYMEYMMMPVTMTATTWSGCDVLVNILMMRNGRGS